MKGMFFAGLAVFAAISAAAFWRYPEPAAYVGPTAPERIAVVYYSHSGHTAAVAEAVGEATGGTMYRLEADAAYPRNAPGMQSQTKAEYNEGRRPPLKGEVPDMSRCDVVFQGFPNWYNAPPTAVFTFLEQSSWQGKVIVPFVTYGLSGWGSSIEDIRAAAPDAVIARGLALTSPQASRAGAAAEPWLQSLGLRP